MASKPTTVAHIVDPGAKPCLLIDGDRWDDWDWLARLFAISAAHLPAPAPGKASKAPSARRPKTG